MRAGCRENGARLDRAAQRLGDGRVADRPGDAVPGRRGRGAAARHQRRLGHARRRTALAVPEVSERARPSAGAAARQGREGRCERRGTCIRRPARSGRCNAWPAPSRTSTPAPRRPLGLTEPLQRTLRTTNVIESLNSGVERYTRNVKRWGGGQMIQRWVASALLEAGQRFRRVGGYRDMPHLVAALDALAPPEVSVEQVVGISANVNTDFGEREHRFRRT